MFDLSPEKIMALAVLALVLVGPKELPTIARTIGTALRHIRGLQETLRAELDSVLNAEPDTPPEIAPPEIAAAESTHPPDPTIGDSFQ